MKKYILLLFTFFILIPLWGGGKIEGKGIALGLLPDVNSIPFVIADINGYFEDEMISVEFHHFRSAKDRDTAFLSGNIDCVSSDLLSAAFAINSGFDAEAVSKTIGSYRIVASGISGITSLEDLEGRSMGISRNTIIEYAADSILAKGRIEGGVIKVVIPQIPVRLQMLTEGKIDSALLPEPLATLAVTNGGVFIESTDNLGIEPAVLIFNSEFTEKNEKRLGSFYRAYNRAALYLNTADKEKWIDEIISRMEFPPAVRDALAIPFYPPASSVDPDDIESVLEWLKDRSLVDDDLIVSDILEKSEYSVK